jgi:hypothetical protein
MNTKVLPISNEKFGGTLPLETCKRVLKAREKGLTNEEVYQIRDLLYALSDIDFKLFGEENQKETAIIIELNTDHYETQSHSIHPGQHRRAS